ncbi:MAG: carbonic anhydrase [Rhodothermales bacterium]|nr:carbonic anhydrase [Rhodothermales bacterium]
MIPAAEALERLKHGNRRFVESRLGRTANFSDAHRSGLATGQEPFAVILGCADSRVPPEIVFDQTLGDLFVIRIAGNVATPAVTGSVEFAAGQLGTRLVVVLGHSGCGAVQATLSEVDSPSGNVSPNLGSIVEDILPVVRDIPADDPAREDRAIQANVMQTVRRLTEQSELLGDLQSEGGLSIVGAEYDLETGSVLFLDV